jgi:hypothetical protein
MIALLVIVLAAGYPAAAKCCSLGGGASYNFLGDYSLAMSDEELQNTTAEGKWEI